MRINYTGRKIELAPAERKKIEAQFAKVGKLLDGKDEREAHVVLSRHLHQAEVTVNYHNHELVGIGSNTDLFNAIHSAADRLEKQAIKVRAKWRDSKRAPRKGTEEAPAAANEPASAPRIAARTDAGVVSPDALARAVVAAKAAEIAERARLRREWIRSFVLTVLPPVLGFALFIGAWALFAQTAGSLPSPAKTWASAVDVFSHPFYQKGPNDQGIGWNILSSLKRVGIGFGLAAAIGIPLGFIFGRFAFANAMASPIISLLRPVSPLAWLPIGLLAFKAANPAGRYWVYPHRH